VACEFSGIVRDAFEKRGHNAWSCDLLPSETVGQHYQGDVKDILGLGWDLMIAFPPCTHLAVSGARWFKEKGEKQKAAIDFFMMLANTEIDKIAIENPVGIMSTVWRKPDQIIQPYYFGDPFTKTTCLWLKGLPKLFHAEREDLFISKPTHTERGEFVTFKSGKRMSKWMAESFGDGHKRSKTFPGIAKAMAEQWG